MTIHTFKNKNIGSLRVAHIPNKLYFSADDLVEIFKKEDKFTSDRFKTQRVVEESDYISERGVFNILHLHESDIAKTVKRWLLFDILPVVRGGIGNGSRHGFCRP